MMVHDGSRWVTEYGYATNIDGLWVFDDGATSAEEIDAKLLVDAHTIQIGQVRTVDGHYYRIYDWYRNSDLVYCGGPAASGDRLIPACEVRKHPIVRADVSHLVWSSSAQLPGEQYPLPLAVGQRWRMRIPRLDTVEVVQIVKINQESLYVTAEFDDGSGNLAFEMTKNGTWGTWDGYHQKTYLGCLRSEPKDRAEEYQTGKINEISVSLKILPPDQMVKNALKKAPSEIYRSGLEYALLAAHERAPLTQECVDEIVRILTAYEGGEILDETIVANYRRGLELSR